MKKIMRDNHLVECGLRDVVLGDPNQLSGVEGVEDESERQPATHLRHQGQVMLLLRALGETSVSFLPLSSWVLFSQLNFSCFRSDIADFC